MLYESYHFYHVISLTILRCALYLLKSANVLMHRAYSQIFLYVSKFLMIDLQKRKLTEYFVSFIEKKSALLQMIQSSMISVHIYRYHETTG